MPVSTQDRARVYRFGDTVAFQTETDDENVASSPTVYLDPAHAARLGASLLTFALSCERESFQASPNAHDSDSADGLSVAEALQLVLENTLTDEQAERVGNLIASETHLISKKGLSGGGERYMLANGDKTAKGVALTLARILTNPDDWEAGK